MWCALVVIMKDIWFLFNGIKNAQPSACSVNSGLIKEQEAAGNNNFITFPTKLFSYFKFLWFSFNIFLSGVKNVNEAQLRTIASDPDEIHMFSVIDSSFLLDIVANLTINLCNSANSSGRQRVCYHQTVIHVNTTLICWCQN